VPLQLFIFYIWINSIIEISTQTEFQEACCSPTVLPPQGRKSDTPTSGSPESNHSISIPKFHLHPTKDNIKWKTKKDAKIYLQTVQDPATILL
jgi:hypothetical protein